MSFNTSLSGLNAAQADLGVISQDIANVATVGYKESRAEFGDIMATSALGSGSTAIGSGVLLNNVSQQFHQGNTNFTSNSLDMAITGEGFFVTTPGTDSSDFVYTRAGQFGVDADGNVVNSTGGVLRAFQTNADGTVTSTSLDTTIPLRLPTTSGSPQQTSEVELSLNLDARTGVNFAPPLDRDGVNGAALAFDATDSSTYTRSTSVKIYDSLGQSHIQTLFFTKLPPNPAAAAGAADEDTLWEVRMQVDGQDVNISGVDGTGADMGGDNPSVRVGFNAQGNLAEAYEVVPGTPANPGPPPTAAVPPTFTQIQSNPVRFITEELGSGGAGILTSNADGSQELTLNLGPTGANATTRQLADSFSVNSIDQDGFPPGQLTGIEISDTGVVRANFSNGLSESLGKVALARFQNNQGLTQLGNTSWRESIDSGTVIGGEANTSGFGLIRSGATENSNVDLTKELVNLITAQRNFQANSKGIEANNQITNTILQIR